jgi:hypothetical protein
MHCNKLVAADKGRHRSIYRGGIAAPESHKNHDAFGAASCGGIGSDPAETREQIAHGARTTVTEDFDANEGGLLCNTIQNAAYDSGHGSSMSIAIVVGSPSKISAGKSTPTKLLYYVRC